MSEIELYDKRFDWLVASLLAIPLVWLFYAFDAAFISLLLFALVGALKPVIAKLGSRLSAGIFAAGMVLMLSPLLRYVSYNGYCFDGPWSVAEGASRYQMPNLCERGLFAHFNQNLWVGPLRDLAMPVLGLTLILFVWLDARSTSESENDADDSGYQRSSVWRASKSIKGGLFALVLLAWAGGSFINHRTKQAELERQRVAEVVRRAAEAEEAADEARRAAAEKAAKQVDRKWLIDGWAPLDTLSDEVRKNPKFYCATDTGYTFNSDGTYVGASDEGKFSLGDNEVYLTNRTSFEIGEIDDATAPLEPATLSVERSGSRLLIDGTPYGRC